MMTSPIAIPSPLPPNIYGSLLRRDLVAFIQRAFCELNPQGRFQSAPYIELLASRLEDCRTGKIKRLIINLPPRSLKSHSATVVFPAWLLGHNPTIEIIAASYGQDLVTSSPATLARSWRAIGIGPSFQHACLHEGRSMTSRPQPAEHGWRLQLAVS